MQNLMNDLTKLFQKDERIFADGKLLKNKLTELALKLDQPLIELLLSDDKAKEHFFIEKTAKKEKVLVFDKDKFIAFVNNKEFLPESFTSFKNKIGLMTNGDYLKEKSDVVLAWAYKDCVLEGGQDKENQKRDEIFYNETLSPDEIDHLFEPKVLTNFKKHDIKGEHKVMEFNAEDNLVIKGNNLLALHCIKKKYCGKVKLIYIDPPYYFGEKKEGDTFNYNSNFKLSTWLTFHKSRLQLTRELLTKDGVIFIHGNDDSQAYLKVICDEIFNSANYVNTIAVNLKNIAGASGGGEDKRFKKNIEYIHIYAKDYDLLPPFQNLYDFTELFELIQKYEETGVSWKYTSVLCNPGKKKYLGSTVDGSQNDIKIYLRENPIFMSIKQVAETENISEKEVYYKYFDKIFQTAMPQSSIRPRVMAKVNELGINGDFFSIEYMPRSGKNKNTVYEQFYKGSSFRLLAWLKDVAELKDDKLCKKDLLGTYWDYVGETKNLSKEGQVVLNNGKKPEKLLKNIIECASNEGDIVLDFYLASGTTCAVAHKMKRKYIGIEQLDYGDNDSIQRLQNVINGDKSGISEDVNFQGGGSFIYAELMEWNEKYIQDIKDADSSHKLLNVYEKMKKEAFFRYDIDLSKFEEKEFEKLPLKEQKQILCECLDKNHLYVNLSEIDDATYKVSADDKKLNKEFYTTVV